MPGSSYTHIWDIEELAWYESHRDSTILVVPACAEYYNATRATSRPLLFPPEMMLPRGTDDDPACPVCQLLNMQIRQGVQKPDIWAELAEAPKENV